MGAATPIARGRSTLPRWLASLLLLLPVGAAGQGGQPARVPIYVNGYLLGQGIVAAQGQLLTGPLEAGAIQALASERHVVPARGARARNTPEAFVGVEDVRRLFGAPILISGTNLLAELNWTAPTRNWLRSVLPFVGTSETFVLSGRVLRVPVAEQDAWVPLGEVVHALGATLTSGPAATGETALHVTTDVCPSCRIRTSSRMQRARIHRREWPGLSAATNSLTFYGPFTLAAGSSLSVTTHGGTGDVNLFLRRDGLPSEQEAECASTFEGTREICTVDQPGGWYVMLHAAESFSGVTLSLRFAGSRQEWRAVTASEQTR